MIGQLVGWLRALWLAAYRAASLATAEMARVGDDEDDADGYLADPPPGEERP